MRHVHPAREAVAARLTARRSRAEALAGRHSAVADVLTGYAAVVDWQMPALGQAASVLSSDDGGRPFSERLDRAAAAAIVPSFLAALRGSFPAAFERAVAALPTEASWWARLFDDVWRAPTGAAGPEGEVARFVAESVLQPFAELASHGAAVPGPGPHGTGGDCPSCGGRAVSAVLREQGHGAGRELICGFCAAGWRVPRAVCPACGETGVERLPVYHDETWPAVRLDACDTCRIAIKTVDRTVDGHADPFVDDLASLPLDLWASAQGYRRLRPALLRL